MTAHTDGTLMDDAELIGMLQRVATEGTPPLRYDIERVLARGRRARRRRQVLMLPASGLAVAGAVALVFAMAHGGTDQQQQLFLSPAASGTQESPHSTAQADTDRQVLQDAFGDDFTIGSGGETGPTPGNVTVRPGSPSADGLPTGVTLWTQLLYGRGHGGIPASQLEEFCAPMVEKGLHRSACTQHILPGGQVVYEQRGRYNLGEYKREPQGGLPSDGIRVIYAQTNGQLVIVDLVASEDESSSTPEGRAAVQAWLDGMTSRLAAAATDPRIDAMTGVNYEPKGSRAVLTPAG